MTKSNNRPPTWFPLCWDVSSEYDSLIMVSCWGKSQEETMSMFNKLMDDNDIVLDDDVFLLAKDCDVFKRVMEEAGWKKEFIAFGP